MSQLGEFLATIQNNQDVRTAALEERLAQLEAKEECGCAETISTLEQRLAELEAKDECGCGSYDELLASYGERISDLESSGGTGGSGGDVLPASICYNKTGFVRNSGYSYNRSVEVWVNNPVIGATYSLAGTAEAVEPITYDGTAEVRWCVQTPGDTGTVTLSQTLGDTSTEIGSVAITAVDSDPLLRDETGLAGIEPIKVCASGGIFMYCTSFNPANPVTRIDWRASSEDVVKNASADSNVETDNPCCLLLMCNPLESGTITFVGYDAYGNRTNEVTYDIVVDKMTILVRRFEDGDNHKYYFALLECQNSITIMLETKQQDGETWSAYELSEEDKQNKTVTLPKSIFDSTLVRASVLNDTTGCIIDAIPLTSDMSSTVIRFGSQQ